MNATPPAPELEALRCEFLSYPGMCLTVEQVARLLDVRRDEAMEALIVLEAEGLLIGRANGSYRSASPLLS
jgi:DNA-binding GntR family transcriptional regulator